MIEDQLITTIADALKGGGFAGLAKQKSSRSVTVSASKGERRAVVHITDPDPALGVRFGINPDAQAVTETTRRAYVPTPVGTYGVGTNGAGTKTARATAVKAAAAAKR
jgi:hypothetical protein